MKLEVKLQILDEVYAIYDRLIDKENYFCKELCSYCCTCNLTVTTLEAYKVICRDANIKSLFFLNENDLRLRKNYNCFVPKITVNKMAELCSRKESLFMEDNEKTEYEESSCFALCEGKCEIYDVRPFACRCMFSSADCGKLGAASMDAYMVTVNSVFIQCIEHIDFSGLSGNFYDVLDAVNSEKFLYQYENELSLDLVKNDFRLIKNSPVRVFILPKEHVERVELIVSEIKTVLGEYNFPIF